jgi:hypothetical protein
VAKLIFGKTMKGAPVGVPLASIDLILDRNQEVHLLVAGAEDGEDGPATIRITDLNFAEVCEMYEDYA